MRRGVNMSNKKKEGCLEEVSHRGVCDMPCDVRFVFCSLFFVPSFAPPFAPMRVVRNP